MKTKYIISIWLCALGMVTFGQSNIQDQLNTIRSNNRSLKAVRSQIDADKMGNRTHILPDNPEIEMDYKWGNPSELGNQTEIKITQSMDFPSSYFIKGNISKMKNEQLETLYNNVEIEVVSMARSIIVELIYYNNMIDRYENRLQYAEKLMSAYQGKYDAGASNAIDLNKAKINYSSLLSDLNTLKKDRLILQTNLEALNGNQSLEINQRIYIGNSLPADFDAWYNSIKMNIPEMAMQNQQVEIEKRNVSLQRAMSLPKIKAGYITEQGMNDSFSGVTAGISIPLWQNARTVKHAKLTYDASQESLADKEIKLYAELKNLYLENQQLESNFDAFKEQVESINSSSLLEEALNEGEISLIEYLLELSFYYESWDKLLDLQRQVNLANVGLFRYE